MKLLMLKIGARPKGRLIEQHDIIFCAVNDFSQVIDIVNNTWKEAKNNWHIDAWREINRVGDYRIELLSKTPETSGNSDNSGVNETTHQLYFINLGGYLPDVFEEFHYKDLVVAESIAKATAQVKHSEFYKTHDLRTVDALTGINGVSHVDDKMGVDIDEIHCVNNLLGNMEKGFSLNAYQLNITPLSETEK